MDSTRSVRMDEAARNAFLGDGGTGVVSAARSADEPPYSLPVSYGYDAAAGDFYLRLGFGPDSAKEAELGDGTPVTLVVYDRTDDGWRSVVARGTLAEVTEAAIDSAVAQAMGRVHIPLVDVFERPPREVTFRFFRLDPTDVSGRKEARTAD
jgi:hypothetical protein